MPFRHRFILEEVDITKPGNEHWFGRYRYEIPVFHFEGKFLMKNVANVQLFENVLNSYEKSVTY